MQNPLIWPFCIRHSERFFPHHSFPPLVSKSTTCWWVFFQFSLFNADINDTILSDCILSPLYQGWCVRSELLQSNDLRWGFHICHCAQPPCFPVIKLPTPPGSLINTSKQCVKLNSMLSYSLQNLLGTSVPLKFPSPTPSTSSITGAGHYENVPQIQPPSLYKFSPKLHLFSKLL